MERHGTRDTSTDTLLSYSLKQMYVIFLSFSLMLLLFFFFIKKYKELENSSPFYVEPQGSSDVCERACNNCLHRRMSNLHLNHSPVAHPLPSSDEAFYNGTHQLNQDSDQPDLKSFKINEQIQVTTIFSCQHCGSGER